MAPGSGFRFDADSEDELDGDGVGSPGSPEVQARDEDGIMVDGMRVDWGEHFGEHFDDLDAGAAHASFEMLGADSEALIQLPGGDAAQRKGDWCARAETALRAKTSREALNALAAAPDSETAPETRDGLLRRVSDADAFGTRALAALRERRPLEQIEALLAEGLELGVETRELVRVQQCVRQALELQDRLAAFDICEEQMELRGLKGILNEMERLPVMLPEEPAVRERWSLSNAWLDRARAILNPPRTRQSKQDAHCNGARQRFALQDIESLVQEGATMPLVCNRAENRDLEVFLQNFTTWREDARSMIASTSEQAAASACLQEREEELNSLVKRGAEFWVECEESSQLEVLLWACRAETVTRGKTSMKDLVELCDSARTIAVPEALLQKLEEKKRKADDWVKRAQGALKNRWEIEDCKQLLQDALALEIDSEEAFLLEYQLEAADSWRERVHAQLALSLDDSDYKVLKALVKESDSIAVKLDLIKDLDSRMDDIERKEQEESECEWAQCDGCNKWRRLGKGQVIAEDEKFFCSQVAKTCDDAEDEWDEEKEEITRLDQESDFDSDADDDVSLADRRLMVPGALVYAQHEYYPFWPARIVDPGADHITAELLRVRRHGHLLLQFLGKTMGSGMKWIDRRKLVPFTPDADPNDKQGMRPIRSQDYKVAVQAACVIFKRQKREVQRRERRAAGREGSISDSDTSDSSDYSDNSEEEVIDYGEEYKETGRSHSKRRRKSSSSAKGSRVDSKGKPAAAGGQSSSKRSSEVRKDKKRARAEHGGEGGSSKRAKGDGNQNAARKKDAAADSAPLFPKWFLQLPISWQGSYSHYTAVRDEEQKLKQRLASLTAQEDIRREVRNMVFCAFIKALAHDAASADSSGAGGSSNGATTRAPQSAQHIENALFTSCDSTITAEYRKRYRVLAMALRVCPNVRSAIARGTLTPSAVVGMSSAALDAYGKASANKKPAVALPAAGGVSSMAKTGDSKAGAVEVKVEVKEERAAARAVPPERAVKVAPLKVPSLLPEVKSKVERPSRSPSPDSPAAAKTRGGGDAADGIEESSAQHGQGGRAGRPSGGFAPEAGGGAKRDAGLELAIVGEVCWVGSLCKAESSTQVRVKSTALDGARLRAVDRVPHALKIVGRMPPEALAKFLVDLGSSRSRQKTVVRFELPEDGVRDAKAYNRLVEEYESKNRVGVINLPERNEQLYIVGPSAAHRVLRLDAPGHVLHGVFVMKVGNGGRYWADVYPPQPTERPPVGGEKSVHKDVKGERAEAEAEVRATSTTTAPGRSEAGSRCGDIGGGVGGSAASADVESAFVVIQALLEATQGEAPSAQVDRGWAAPRREPPPQPPPQAGPHRRPQGEWQGAGMPAALPPPPVPHPSAMHRPAQAPLAPPPVRAPPTGVIPSPQRLPQHLPAQPPITNTQHAGYAAGGSAACYGGAPHVPVPHVPPVRPGTGSTGYGAAGNTGYGAAGSIPTAPGPELVPPPGAPGDPNHALNLQQLQNLSTEQLISLCTQIGMG